MAVRAFGRRTRAAAAAPAQSESSDPAAAATAAAERQAVPQVRPTAGAAVADIVARVHPTIVKSLDMAKISSLNNEQLANQLLSFLDTEEAGAPDLSPLDRQQVVTELVHDIKGLGPIEPLLHDTQVSDILINGLDSTYVERNGRLERIDLRFRDRQHLLHIAQRIAGRMGRRVDESSPMVDARLDDGSRVNIIIPPLALDGAAISIRRFVMRGVSLEQMAERRVLSPAMAELFRIGVKARLNILISGGTGAGKTTFMNALSREIDHSERLITIEDAAELQLQQPHVIRLETRAVSAEGTGRVTMRDLLVNTLRMRPDRIIVGEVRGGEANEMLQAMNTGHPGSMCTLHANTPRDALTRLENMLMMGSGDMPLSALRRQISSSVDMVVQLARLRTGQRCVTSATSVVGMENDIVTTEEIWRRKPGDEDHVFETSGRLPSWVDAVDALNLRERLVEALQADPPHWGNRRLTDFLIIVAAALLGTLPGIAFLLLLWNRETRLRRRLQGASGSPTNETVSEGEDSEAIVFRASSGSQWARLRRTIEGRYPLLDVRRTVPRAILLGIASAIGLWASMWFFRIPSGWWTMPIVGLGGLAGTWYAMSWFHTRQAREFTRQFPEIIDQIVRLSAAGLPALEAIPVAAEDARAPVKPVLTAVCDGLNGGLDPDTALRAVSTRVRLADFTLFAAVILLQRRAGGGISAAFATLSRTLRDRRNTALKAQTSTAQTRLTLLVLSVMPVIMLLIQKFISPQSAEILFTTDDGTTLLHWGVGLIVAGLLTAKAIASRVEQ